MFMHNNISFERLDDDNYYTLINDNVIIVNNTAYYIYSNCDNCTEQDVVDRCKANRDLFPNEEVIANDVSLTLQKLLDTGLIISNE